MDYRFTPEEEAFRARARAFLKENLPKDWHGIYPDAYFHEEYWSFVRGFTSKMARLGWLTMAWPREYGGQDLPVMQQVVLNEELGYNRAPHRDVSIGVNMAGPTVMLHGTEEQKKKFLRPIATTEHIYAQAFSEPGAGSDLASLETLAVRDGDEYVINGSKLWTSGAHRSTHLWLLTRTDPRAPKHKGISMFVLPLDSPGITIRPVLNPLNVHYTNQVFFDHVRVPAANRVGPENRGWYVATTTLDFERAGAGRFAAAQRAIEDVTMLAKETRWNGGVAWDNPIYRHALADIAVANHAGKMVGYRVAWMQSKGLIPNQEASAAKLMASEIAQRVAQVGVRLLGLYGQVDRGSKYAALEGHVMADYVTTISFTIRGGTSEVQRNIIAQRGLGLPRS